MAVHLTRIYTRTGDDGTTGLSDSAGCRRTTPARERTPTVDETNAAIGVAVALGQPDERHSSACCATYRTISSTQGADLSTPVVENPEHPPLRVKSDYVDRLESWCDEFNEPLPALNSFVLPGGTPLSALLHVARTGVAAGGTLRVARHSNNTAIR